MANSDGFSLFGFQITKKVEQNWSVVPPVSDDGSTVGNTNSSYYGLALDLEGSVKNENDLIRRYREVSSYSDCDSAIEDIVSEAIVADSNKGVISIELEDLQAYDKLKDIIRNEFDTILKLYDFEEKCHDIFRQWYIDGRLFYNVILDPNPKNGILELRYIDPRKIRKIKLVNKQRDPKTGFDIISNVDEYYLFNDKGIAENSVSGIKMSIDSVIYGHSGVIDYNTGMVLSYLQKAVKPTNQLKVMEDAVVIYRLCLAGNTRVRTTSGWKYIKDINTDDSVYSFYGPELGLKETKVIKQWKTGTKQTYKVKSKHFEISGSDNHPILVLDRLTNIVEYIDIKDIVPKRHSFVYHKPEDIYEYIEFPKIRNKSIKITNPDIWVNYEISKKEDYITLLAETHNLKRSSVRNFLYGIQYLNKEDAMRLLEDVGIINEVLFDEKYEFLSSNADLNLPNFIDEEFARLFGFMLGDGTVHKNGLTFAEGVNEEVNEYYSKILFKYFGNCKLYKNKKRKYNNYTTSSTLGSELFRKLGFLTGAKNKRIPDWLYKCSNNIKKQFILGFADADGCNKSSIYTGVWSSEIALCNEQLIEDIKEVWTSIGLTSGKFHYRKTAASFRTIGSEETPRMMPETESWSVRISDYELPKFDRILDVTEDLLEDVFELEVESEKHNFIANGIVVHNSRAPERRVFYIDVGNLPKLKAEQYVQEQMNRYRNKVVYDANTGTVKDNRQHLSMIEDFWLARRNSGQGGTEITTLQGGQNLSSIEDINYFQNKLYQALNVPISRLQPQQGFSLGHSTEITREEIKFNKFIERLRRKFASIFRDALRIQLITKGIINPDEWDDIAPLIKFDYQTDNHFAELKNSEIMAQRMNMLQQVDPYIGKYFSIQWVRKNVLMQTDEDLEMMNAEMEQEQEIYAQQQQDELDQQQQSPTNGETKQ